MGVQPVSIDQLTECIFIPDVDYLPVTLTISYVTSNERTILGTSRCYRTQDSRLMNEIARMTMMELISSMNQVHKWEKDVARQCLGLDREFYLEEL